MYRRPFYSKIADRIASKRQFIQVIMGPRQVGKTTLIQQFLKDYPFPSHYASADEANNPVWIQQQWENGRLKLTSQDAPEALLVLDEIPKIQDWSRYVKIQWDKDSVNDLPLKVILLGSSQLLLQKGLSESLAGRFEVIYLPHWSFNEMKNAFNFTLNDYIWYGGYPAAASLIREETRWKEYIQHAMIETTLMRDIIQMVRIDKPALLRNLFELGCNWSGQILSYNKILGQFLDAGNTTTLAHYLKLLEGAGMLCGIEKYSAIVIRQRSSSPKFQVLNMALMSAQSSMTKEEVFSKPEILGRWIESAIGAFLTNLCKIENTGLYYWRESNHEMDFVIKSGQKIAGIEVKSSKPGSLSGTKKFNDLFKPSKILLVGQDGISPEEFLGLNIKDILS